MFEELPLSNLTSAECCELVRARLGTEPPRAAVKWLHARTGGNPLFLLEVLRQLSKDGSLWNDGSTWQWREPRRQTLSETVEALIWEQLQSFLHPSARAALEARAYLETRLPECVDQPELLDRLTWSTPDGVYDPGTKSASRSLEQSQAALSRLCGDRVEAVSRISVECRR